MKRIPAIAAIVLLFSGVESARSEIRLADVMNVLGRVTESARPVDDALVIAFNLTSSYIVQTNSAETGAFRLPPLPSGVYRIIAVKTGFAPAIATVTPSTTGGHQVTLRLKNATEMTREDRDAVWEARRAIPPDILRDLNIISGDLANATQTVPPARFRGEMSSMTAIAGGDTANGLAETALGVHGVLASGWQVGLSGSFRTIDDGSGTLLPTASEDPVAQATGLTMEISSGGASSYRLATTRNSWLVDESASGDVRAAVEAHDFQWRRNHSQVQFRYLSHANLFDAGPFGTELMELAAESRVVDGSRNRLGVALRVGQESLSGAALAMPYRTADLATRGSFELVDAIELRYGLASRISDRGTEWAPESGVLIRLSPHTSILFEGTYKIEDADHPLSVYPSLAYIERPWGFAPRSRYGVSLTSGGSDRARFAASASVAEVDSRIRVVFDDQFEEFWDALYLAEGDVWRDVSLAVSRKVGDSFMVDLSSRAGYATRKETDAEERVYVSGSLRSQYVPSGTALLLAWRYIDQPGVTAGVASEQSERVNIRVAQSLGLPLGLRLLLGVDLGRAVNSPVLADTDASDEFQKRVVGGVSLEF